MRYARTNDQPEIAGTSFQGRAAMAVVASAVLSMISFSAAHSNTPSRLLHAASKGGCMSKGVWYPEGTRVKPDARSRIMMSGEFVCRSGRWVFESTAR